MHTVPYWLQVVRFTFKKIRLSTLKGRWDIPPTDPTYGMPKYIHQVLKFVMNEENKKESHARNLFFLVLVQFWKTIATQIEHEHEFLTPFAVFTKNWRRKIKFSKWTICHGCSGWKQLLSNINLANCSKIISGGCFPFFSNSARPCVGYCCPSVRLSIVQSWSSFWLLLLPSREIWSCFDHHSRSCAMIKSLSCQ